MTRSSRYALPVAERCAGTISAGQRWYGRNAKACGPGAGNSQGRTSEPLSHQEVGMTFSSCPQSLMQTPRVSGGDD